MASRRASTAVASAQGFEFISPWMPAKVAEGFYVLAFSAKHARMFRWRLRRVHGRDPETHRAWVVWELDESTSPVEPPIEGAIMATAELWDEPRRLVHPRDKHEASVVVAERWRKIQAAPMGGAVPQ